VFNWRRNKEINYEEFKLLSMEWNKTCKLLTSGNFFLNITHYQELFHERWFFSILRDMYGTSELEEETAFIYESRSEQFLEKLKETPFLGYDFVQKAIYSVEENQIKQMQYYYRFLDPEGKRL
jgi:hypothetical protein